MGQMYLSVLIVGVLLNSAYCLTKEEYPNVVTNAQECWNHAGTPPPNLRICDPNALVSDVQATKLHNLAGRVLNETKCPCSRTQCHMESLSIDDYSPGYTITLILVKTMGISSDLVNGARDYTEYLRKEGGYYGPSFGRCEEDIIIFLSYEQKVVYVLTGGRAKILLTNLEIESIIQDSKSSFTKSVFSGLQFLVETIEEELK